MSRNRRLLLAVAVVAAVFGYKALKPGDGDHKPAPDAAPVAIAPAKPHMLGTLAFQPCNLRSILSRDNLQAQCTTFEVPEDRARPDGRKIALNIAWLPASNEGDAAPDPLFLLAGGPGQSAVETFPAMNPLLKEVRKYRHILLVDQRGTGKSNLLSCKDTSKADPDTSPAAMQVAAEKCAAALGKKADLRHYTTTDAIADLEAVRKAIGATQANLMGVSYGTRVAQQYAMRHPQAIRSIVLDSPVPNTIKLGNIFARNLDDALALQFAQCTKAAACKGKLGDPRAELDALLARLRAQPVTVQYRDATSGEQKNGVLRAETVAGLVRMYAYMPAAGALLPKLIHEANAGRYQNLMALAQMMTGNMEDAMAMGMQLSVVCSEDGDSMLSRQEDAGTVLGNLMPQGMAAMCKAWPKGQVPADFNKPLATAVPALVIAGEFDPVTPPRYAEAIAKSLPNARVLVAKGQGHSVMGRGCLPRLVADFVDKLDPKQLDAGCIADFAALPAFIDFNGAAP